MPRHHAPSILLFALATLASSSASAGAWSQPAGQCYAKVWSSVLIGANAFGVDAPGFETDPFSVIALNHYAECGVAKDWTLLTSGAPVGFARHGEDDTLFSGRLALGVRRGFLEGPLRAAIELEYGHQGLVGDIELAPNQRYSFRPVVAAHTGRASASVGYGAASWWATGDVGLRVFSGELTPAVVGNAQLGWKPLESLVLDIHFPYNITLGSIDENNVSGAGDTNYVGLGLGASWWVTQGLGLNLGLDGVVFAEANAGAPSIQLGVEWRPRLW